MMNFNLRILVIFIHFFLISGCFSPVNSPIEKKYFFNPHIHTVHSIPGQDTLLISKPTTAPGYTSYQMVYMEKPFELAYYTRNRWVAPPADMLQPLLFESLQKTDRFSAIGSSSFIGKTNYRLESTLMYLRQNLITTPNQMEIGLQIWLINNQTQTVIASRFFKKEAVIPETHPYAGVLVTNQLLEELLDDIARFIIEKTI